MGVLEYYNTSVIKNTRIPKHKKWGGGGVIR